MYSKYYSLLTLVDDSANIIQPVLLVSKFQLCLI